MTNHDPSRPGFLKIIDRRVVARRVVAHEDGIRASDFSTPSRRARVVAIASRRVARANRCDSPNSRRASSDARGTRRRASLSGDMRATRAGRATATLVVTSSTSASRARGGRGVARVGRGARGGPLSLVVRARATGARAASVGVEDDARGWVETRGVPRRRSRIHGVVRASASASASGDASEAGGLGGAAGALTQVLSGLTVSLAMVPESLAFTFVAGVSPIVGLHAAALMGLATALLGAQPGVISGAAGATAVVFAPLVASHGVEYLFAAVLLVGVIQVACGAMRLGKFIRLVPQPCMIGFVNGLAIVIGMSQLETFAGLSGNALGTTLALTAFTMALIRTIPKLSFVPKGVPAPLLAIASCATLTNSLKIATKTVGDVAPVSGALPSLHLPNVPVSLETLTVIAPYALSVAAVGLIETLLTQQLVDDVTEKRTATHTECIAQGVGNLVNGVCGAMGGCAMIGQSMINVNSGGRTRIAGVTCALAILSYVSFGASFIERIPMAALTGTMLCLVLDIFDWTSFSRIKKIPKTDAVVLFLVTGVTVATNLAVAVFAGVVLSALGFAWKSSQRIDVSRTEIDASEALCELTGPLFFGSVQSFTEKLDPRNEPLKRVVLDFAQSKVWDSSALVAIDELADKYRSLGKTLTLRHLSPDCAKLLTKAEDLIEVDVLTDPVYTIGADYDASQLQETTEALTGRNRRNIGWPSHSPLSPEEEYALKRQYNR